LEQRTVERKLAAIFAADVEGYSRLMGQDEVGTLRTLNRYRAIIDPLIASHRGRIFNTAGDSLVADFGSAVDAVECAVAVQEAIAKENADRPAGEQMRFRIGIHVGDIMVQGDNLFGDAVNIAARLEALAEPGGICVSGVVRDQIGTKLPVGFIDLGEQQVKNITQPIRAYRIGGETSPVVHQVVSSSLPLPDKPSIAVLPFQNMSGDPEQEYFADGMVEEIITALSRIRWLFVIARNSSFTYKGQSVEVRQVGRELGVRYVLEGSVRKAGQRVRITTQLIDAVSDTHLWADRFDGSLEDVFDLQDQVATGVAGVIEPTLQAAETARSARRPTNDLTAYDLFLRALPSFFSLTQDGFRRALDLLDQAITRDLGYGPALAYAAHCRMRMYWEGWSKDPEEDRRRAIDLARRALQSASDDPVALINAAYVQATFEEQLAGSAAIFDRALALNPSYARGWSLSGTQRMHEGQLDIAIEQMQRAMRLSPRERSNATLTVLGVALLLNRQFDTAAETLVAAVQANPGYPASYRGLASCYAHMGRLEEARAVIERLRLLTPAVIPRLVPWRNQEQRELYLSGLRLAAGEAT
jgi:adenylate cyclase